ncbi:MAG: hypothetical protein IT371_15555 [Deltaproteobacteria bacterium]|nr:hypothetical protein [Deltaproteobacteria bacterium]
MSRARRLVPGLAALLCTLSLATASRAETPAAGGDWFSLATELHQAALGLNGAGNRLDGDGLRVMAAFEQAVLALHQKHIGERVGDEAFGAAISRLPSGATDDHAFERHTLLLQGLSTASFALVNPQVVDNAFTVAAMSVLSSLDLLNTDLPKLTAEHRQLAPREGHLGSKEAGRLLDVRSKMARLRKASAQSAVFALGDLLGGSRNFSFGAPKRPGQGFFARLLAGGRR